MTFNLLFKDVDGLSHDTWSHLGVFSIHGVVQEWKHFCYNIKNFHFGIFTCKSYFAAAEAFLVLAESTVDNSILVKLKLKTTNPWP